MPISRQIADNTIGLDSFGEGLFGEGNEITYVLDTEQSDLTTPRASQLAWGAFTQRAWGRSYPYPARVISDESRQVAIVSFGTFSGGLFGGLRTDIRYPIIKSLKFVRDRQGCADFEIILNSVPPFHIFPGAIVSIKIGTSPLDNYTGYVEYAPDQGTRKSEYRIQGFGFRKQLKEWVRMPDDTTSVYPFGLKAGEIVDDIAFRIVRGNTNVRYNTAKIDKTAGVATANELDFGTFDISKVFDSLAQLAGCRWGVDDVGDLYFEEFNSNPVRVHFVGYDMGKFEVLENSEQIANSITVERTVGRGSGGNGYAIAGVYSDATSIAKYGLREFTQRVPGFFGDDECDIIGQTVLESRKDPQMSAKVDRFYLRTERDLINRGVHRFIMPVEDFNTLILEDENASDYTKTGSGDTVISNNTTFVVQGANSIKLEFTNGENDLFTALCNVNGDLQSIEVWIRSSRVGRVLQIGFGQTLWSENQQNIDISVPNVWQRFRWDVSNLNLRKINVIGYKVLTSQSGEIYLDSSSCVIRGQRHYDFEMQRTTCTIGGGSFQTSEFGQLPLGTSDYTSALIQQTEENAVALNRR